MAADKDKPLIRFDFVEPSYLLAVGVVLLAAFVALGSDLGLEASVLLIGVAWGATSFDWSRGSSNECDRALALAGNGELVGSAAACIGGPLGFDRARSVVLRRRSVLDGAWLRDG